MKKNDVLNHPEPERLWIRFFKIKIENVIGKKPMKLDCMQILSLGFYIQSKKRKKHLEFGIIFNEHGRYR